MRSAAGQMIKDMFLRVVKMPDGKEPDQLDADESSAESLNVDVAWDSEAAAPLTTTGTDNWEGEENALSELIEAELIEAEQSDSESSESADADTQDTQAENEATSGDEATSESEATEDVVESQPVDEVVND